MEIKRKNWIQYIPFILVEIYLIGTLLLMEFGPVQYMLENKMKFWILIILYHVAFAVGYFLLSFQKSNVSVESEILNEKILKWFWILLVISFLVWMVVYRNTTRANSYFPYELPGNFIRGLTHPAERYYWKGSEEAKAQFHGNQPVTFMAALFYPIYFCMPALLIFLWDRLKRIQKAVAYFLIFCIMATAISVATNKLLFDLLFILGSGFMIDLIGKWKTDGLRLLKRRKLIICTIFFLIIFDACYYTYNIRSRVGGNVSEYVGNAHKEIALRNEQENKMAESPVENSIPQKKKERFATSMLVGLTSYVCQGYYGFSLALGEEFTSTYGLGHSDFILSIVDKQPDGKLVSRTYQAKITDRWSRSGNWHSFYSQISNDVSPYGVIFVMLVLGIILAATWRDAHEKNDVVAKCLLILLVIMFLYMPANNQVGNSYGTFFAFWELLILWLFSRIYKRKGRTKYVSK